MNKILTGIAALLLLSATSCGLFKKSTRKQAATPASDSLKVAVVDSSAMNMDTAVARIMTAADSLRLKDSLENLPETIAATPDPAKQELIDGLVPLWNKRTTYKTFSGKAKVHVESPKDKNDVTATIRMEKDKKIWISIVALGVFEAARALITPDTIIVVDRLHKEVTILPFNEAGKLLPVNVEFSELQALLIGDALHASEDMPTDANASGEAMQLDIRTKDFLQQLTFGKTDSAMSRQQMKLGSETGNGPLLVVRYGEYSTIDNRRFANNRVLDVDDAKGRTHIEMQFNRAEFDQELEYNISIPPRYTRK